MTRKAPSPRLLAVRVLLEVTEQDAWSNVALDRVLRSAKRPSQRDVALLTEIVYGTLTWLRPIDLLLERQVHRRYNSLDPQIKAILRMSAYQFTHLDRIPPRAIVNEGVKVARALGYKVHITRFINGVLRGLSRRLDQQDPTTAAPVLPWMPPTTGETRGNAHTKPKRPTRPRLKLPTIPKQSDPIGHIALVWSLPTWIVEQLVAALGLDRAEAVAEQLTQRAPMTLRLHPNAKSRADTPTDASQCAALPEALQALDQPKRTRWSPVGVEIARVNEAFHTLLQEGAFTVQDEAAQLVTELLDPQPDDRVLDACAGLGGKTTHIIERMSAASSQTKTSGRVTAVEPHQHRIDQLRDHVTRLGIPSPDIAQGTLKDLCDTPDAQAVYDPDAKPNTTGFDRVLIDAPCTGLGTLRRHPEIRWTRTPESVTASAQVQADLLDLAATCVRPGGVLVYSVCTWTQAEGIGQVVRFLDQHPSFELDLPDPDDRRFAGLDRDRWGITTWPDRASMDSFFVTRLRRKTAP